MYKTLEDVERVINKGKKQEVLDTFIASYLQGLEKEKWVEARKAEHETLYPKQIPNPDYVEPLPQRIVNPNYVEDGEEPYWISNPDYVEPVDEFLDNPDFITYDEWMAEDVVVQEFVPAVTETVVEGDMEFEQIVTPEVPEVRELVRLYEAIDVSDKVSAYINSKYAELRAVAYPPMADYLDAIVKDDAEAIEAYKQACLAVKAKYPKA